MAEKGFSSTVPFQFKAPEFSGKDCESFDHFTQKLKAYLALIDEEFLEPMEAAEKNQTEMITDEMFVTEAEGDGEDEVDEEGKQRSRRLHWLLTSMISGDVSGYT